MIEYKKNIPVDLDQFIELYKASTLAERRPADDRKVMQQMMENANLTITAWDGEKLIGISRTLTDHAFVAYLADIAVARSYQGTGVGKRLIQETKVSLDTKCMIVLLAAPTANEFYPHIGFKNNPRAWVLAGGEDVE